MKTYKAEFATEANIVTENNEKVLPKPPFFPDPVNVFNIAGKRVGYSWNYGDTVKLILHMRDTVLYADLFHKELSEIYLKDKFIEFDFSDMRGNVIYTFYKPAGFITELPLNTGEDDLIERNTYKLDAVLIDLNQELRINLLPQSYEVYVR